MIEPHDPRAWRGGVMPCGACDRGEHDECLGIYVHSGREENCWCAVCSPGQMQSQEDAMNGPMCEWDPNRDKEAVIGAGCKNEATVIVGSRHGLFMCSDCAAIPRFKRFRPKPLKRRNPTT